MTDWICPECGSGFPTRHADKHHDLFVKETTGFLSRFLEAKRREILREVLCPYCSTRIWKQTNPDRKYGYVKQ